MEHSAGLVIIMNSRILLVHPTNAGWSGTYSIPKGKIENGETPLEAAIRETKEETGIEINIKYINQQPHNIPYIDSHGNIYKTVTYYICEIPDDILPLKINKDQLELQEVDWCGFLTIKEAENKILNKLKIILDRIKTK